MFVDFEGEPDRYLEERRLKGSPLRDLASMLHSFRDAAMTEAERRSGTVAMASEERATIEALALAWYRWGAATFLAGYLDTAGDAAYLPASREEWATLLDAMMLEKTIYALGYALNHAPNQLGRPLRNVLQLLWG
ncbi:MAG TPA: hypothetical protein VGR29_05375 [Thermomicrobiales bacterium]|nr:hypothetical protein [Thermomicrobiales bacterium]